jgi:DNA-directed RNA polymerase II subunit RPB11
MNLPGILDDEILEKIKYKKDEKIENAGIFIIEDEDDTIGNLLRMNLLNNNKAVVYANYKMPHPLERKIEVKIQTSSQSNPISALNDALDNLKQELNIFENMVIEEINKSTNN